MISSYFANKILDHMLRNQAYTPPSTIYFSIHSADPGDAGANEIAVTRVAGTYDAAASKSIALTSTVAITNCPVSTVVAFSVWDAVSSGNMLWAGWLGDAPEAFTAETVSEDITIPAHGFSADDRVVFYDDGVGTLPTGMSEGTLYYVITAGLATDTFRVATTSEGSAINLTTAGQGLCQKVTPKSIGNAGDTFNLTAAPLSLA